MTFFEKILMINSPFIRLINFILFGGEMLDLKNAIKKAFEHFELIYEGNKLPNKLLEEIEYDNEDDIWKVVIGFDSDRVTTKTDGPAMFASTTVKEKERKYKQIRLKGKDGSFVKMIDEMI